MFSLFVSEPWFGAVKIQLHDRHFKMFLFQEMADWAWSCLVCTSVEKQPRASSYKQGKGHHKTSRNQENGSILVDLYIHFSIGTPSPMLLCSGKPHLPLSHIDFSYHFGKDTHILPLPFLSLVYGRDFPCWKGIPKVFSVEERTDLAWKSFFYVLENIST